MFSRGFDIGVSASFRFSFGGYEMSYLRFVDADDTILFHCYAHVKSIIC